MRSQIKLGRIFGIQIGLHLSWLFIAVLIVFSLAGQFHTTNARWSSGLVLGLAIATAILFFVSLLLHELAHSLVARACGMPVREITLFALGGVSQIEKEPVSAKIEFWMAFVGPLTSAAIGGICLLVSKLSGGGSTPVPVMLAWLGYINLSLAVFNLVPGYPLDGGRILRSIIWLKVGNANRATNIAARTGQVVAVLFILLGIAEYFLGGGFGGLWIAFIGWFLLQAAGESRLRAGLHQSLDGVHVADVMSPDCPAVDGNLNLQNFVHSELLRTGRRCFVVTGNGKPLGLITPPQVMRVDAARWPYTTVYDVMQPLDEVQGVSPDASLESALALMGEEHVEQLPVVTDHQVRGFLSRADIVSYLQTRAELDPAAR